MRLTGVLLLGLEETLDLLANLAVGHANVVLEVTLLVHEGEETIVGDVKLEDMGQHCASTRDFGGRR